MISSDTIQCNVMWCDLVMDGSIGPSTIVERIAAVDLIGQFECNGWRIKAEQEKKLIGYHFNSLHPGNWFEDQIQSEKALAFDQRLHEASIRELENGICISDQNNQVHHSCPRTRRLQIQDTSRAISDDGKVGGIPKVKRKRSKWWQWCAQMYTNV